PGGHTWRPGASRAGEPGATGQLALQLQDCPSGGSPAGPDPDPGRGRAWPPVWPLQADAGAGRHGAPGETPAPGDQGPAPGGSRWYWRSPVMGRTHAASGWCVGLLVAPLLGVHAVAQVVAFAALTAGYALLPDLDHPHARATRLLGPLTGFLSYLAQEGSRALYARTKGPRDEDWEGTHRHMTHTLVFAVLAGGPSSRVGVRRVRSPPGAGRAGLLAPGAAPDRWSGGPGHLVGWRRQPLGAGGQPGGAGGPGGVRWMSHPRPGRRAHPGWMPDPVPSPDSWRDLVRTRDTRLDAVQDRGDGGEAPGVPHVYRGWCSPGAWSPPWSRPGVHLDRWCGMNSGL